jgi:hypothetical protein
VKVYKMKNCCLSALLIAMIVLTCNRCFNINDGLDTFKCGLPIISISPNGSMIIYGNTLAVVENGIIIIKIDLNEFINRAGEFFDIERVSWQSDSRFTLNGQYDLSDREEIYKNRIVAFFKIENNSLEYLGETEDIVDTVNPFPTEDESIWLASCKGDGQTNYSVCLVGPDISSEQLYPSFISDTHPQPFYFSRFKNVSTLILSGSTIRKIDLENEQVSDICKLGDAVTYEAIDFSPIVYFADSDTFAILSHNGVVSSVVIQNVSDDLNCNETSTGIEEATRIFSTYDGEFLIQNRYSDESGIQSELKTHDLDTDLDNTLFRWPDSKCNNFSMALARDSRIVALSTANRDQSIDSPLQYEILLLDLDTMELKQLL